MPQAVLRSHVRIAALITLLVLLVLAVIEARQWRVADQNDFDVYLTAAQLVHEHKSLDIYNGADTGQDPQMRFAPANSIFQRTASAKGIPAVRLYVYPPTLADLLTPLTFLSLQHAKNAWLALNILTIVFAAMLTTWMLYDRVFPIACLAIFAGILCFRPNIMSLAQGQISCVLLFLWVAGIVLYVKGYKRISAAIFALATAIKLTPLLVLLPFLIWREWKWLRWYALSLVGLCLLLCLVNHPQVLIDYVLHVMPPMSAGYPANANISLPTEIPQLYLCLAGGARKLSLMRSFFVQSASVPTIIVRGAKLIAVAVLCAAFFSIHRLGNVRSALERAKILTFIALLSLYCSPVAWQSAYGIVFLVALFCGKKPSSMA